MSVLQYGGALIEITVLSNGDADGWVAEVWDLTPESGGEVMHAHLSPNGELTIDLLGGRLNAEFLLWCVDAVRREIRDLLTTKDE
jgi:hypothetical protein